MRRIKLIVAYDGTHYAGYQVQPNGNTILAEIESVLARMHRHPVKIVASGRTDARVHALGQVIHFDTSLEMPAERFVKALNAMLPDDILVKQAEEMDDTFHARYGAKRKEYRYHIRQTEDPFRRHYAATVTYKLSLEAMRQAMERLIGTHDFTSFSVTKAEVEDRVRTIYLRSRSARDGGRNHISVRWIRLFIQPSPHHGRDGHRGGEREVSAQRYHTNARGEGPPRSGDYRPPTRFVFVECEL